MGKKLSQKVRNRLLSLTRVEFFVLVPKGCHQIQCAECKFSRKSLPIILEQTPRANMLLSFILVGGWARNLLAPIIAIE